MAMRWTARDGHRGMPFIKRRGKDVKFSWFFKGINKNYIKRERMDKCLSLGVPEGACFYCAVLSEKQEEYRKKCFFTIIVATLLIKVRINTTLLSEIKFELQSLWKWFIRRPYYYYCYQKGPVGISRPSAAESRYLLATGCSCSDKVHGRRVDAVPFPGGRWSILEDVSHVRLALGTPDLRPDALWVHN